MRRCLSRGLTTFSKRSSPSDSFRPLLNASRFFSGASTQNMGGGCTVVDHSYDAAACGAGFRASREHLKEVRTGMACCRVPSRFPCSRRLLSSVTGHHADKAVEELNKEMELVFGEPPASGPTGSGGNSHTLTISPDSEVLKNDFTEIIHGSKLTHVDNKGEARMVNVSPKEISKRVALASCKVILGKEAFDLVSSNQLGKGDVLSVAKIAGISGAKQTSSLIPLCHNICLTHVRVDLALNPSDFSVHIEGEAACLGKTGVEMEALTAVSVAGLTVYDMCKAVSKNIQITEIQLEHKTGGKSGDWSRKNT